MRSMQASEDRIEAEIALLKPDDHFEVLPENMAAIEWFISTDDLYIWNGPVCVGLDVKAVRDDAILSGRKTTPDDYNKLRLLGQVYADELTKKMLRAKHD
ncbi:MAG: hypothetical protein CMK08_13235 [Ponticaulis sp.]|nr:hypothetical protein [Ponticaulis sp.]